MRKLTNQERGAELEQLVAEYKARKAAGLPTTVIPESTTFPPPPSIIGQNLNTTKSLTPEIAREIGNSTNLPEFTAAAPIVQKGSSVNAASITKTINPKLADLNYTQNTDLLKTASNIFNTFLTGFEREVQISLDYYSVLQKCDTVQALSDFYKKLEQDSLPILRNDFVDFWVKRFQLTTEPLKTELIKNLNVTNSSFFTELSDSIGILVNSSCLLDDATIPFTDITTGLYTAPNTVPVQLRNKISNTTLSVCYDLSKNNTILMNTNLKNIMLTSNDSDPHTSPVTVPAHGMNLITDINTYNIIKTNLNNYFNKLTTYYKRIFTYIQYTCNIKNIDGYNSRNAGTTGTNQQIITNIEYIFDIEKFHMNVDLLQRGVKKLLSYKTINNTLSNPVSLNDTDFTEATSLINNPEAIA